MKHIFVALAAVALSIGGAMAQVPRTKSPDGAKVYFINLKEGATVPQTFLVQFGLSGMGVAPAGVDKPNTGHHHLLVDIDTSPDMGQPLPANDNIRHFGGGQTEAMITLKPGQHTLQLLLGDQNHIPHDQPVMSEWITIMSIDPPHLATPR